MLSRVLIRIYDRKFYDFHEMPLCKIRSHSRKHRLQRKRTDCQTGETVFRRKWIDCKGRETVCREKRSIVSRKGPFAGPDGLIVKEDGSIVRSGIPITKQFQRLQAKENPLHSQKIDCKVRQTECRTGNSVYNSNSAIAAFHKPLAPRHSTITMSFEAITFLMLY